jgi:hypothetical protein
MRSGHDVEPSSVMTLLRGTTPSRTTTLRFFDPNQNAML